MWTSESLWLKAKTYIDRANAKEHGDSEFPLLSSLSLELLARAALTKVHPVLNADPQDYTNLLYAFGYNIKEPRSIPLHSVFIRLEKIVDGFTKQHREFCDFMTILRNQELHTGELAFDNLAPSKWLARFYEVASVLCRFIDKSLEDYVGEELAESAQRMIEALNSADKKAVMDKIAAHAKVFLSKSSDEQKALRESADAAMKYPFGDATRIPCPACNCPARGNGEWVRDSRPVYDEGQFYLERLFMVASLTCSACGLTLANHTEIHHAELEPRFTRYAPVDLHELFQQETGEDYNNM